MRNRLSSTYYHIIICLYIILYDCVDAQRMTRWLQVVIITMRKAHARSWHIIIRPHYSSVREALSFEGEEEEEEEKQTRPRLLSFNIIIGMYNLRLRVFIIISSSTAGWNSGTDDGVEYYIYIYIVVYNNTQWRLTRIKRYSVCALIDSEKKNVRVSQWRTYIIWLPGIYYIIIVTTRYNNI